MGLLHFFRLFRQKEIQVVLDMDFLYLIVLRE